MEELAGTLDPIPGQKELDVPLLLGNWMASGLKLVWPQEPWLCAPSGLKLI